jgi:inhibitor of KinA sporulation pathway (predicted exonuclease)
MARDLRHMIIVDLEATCWLDGQKPLEQTSEIIEMGCVKFEIATGIIVKEMSILVKPQFSQVSPFCTELTTITQDLLDKEGVLFPEALEIFKREFKPRETAWMSYGDYDRKQVDRNCDLYKVKNPFSSTHHNIKNLFAITRKLNKEVGMDGALKLLGFSLAGTHHRGLDDAKNIYKIALSVLAPEQIIALRIK